MLRPEGNAQGDPDRDETKDPNGVDSVHPPKQRDRDVPAVKREQGQEAGYCPPEADPSNVRDDRVQVKELIASMRSRNNASRPWR
jgi:hypothetical protein